MKLSQNITKPSVSSRLELTKAEVICALKKYAESEGYLLDDSVNYDFYVQENYQLYKTYILASNSSVGTNKPITKGD